MPRILITGLPNALQGTESLRDLLVTTIPLSVEGTDGFDLSRHHVFVHALPDLADVRPARVVTFTVEGLLEKPTRTAQMRHRLCERVAQDLAAFLAVMEIQYESVVGWCVQIRRDEDGFVRLARPSNSP